MPRKAQPLTYNKKDIIDLNRLSHQTDQPRIAARATMILRCIEGQQIKDIAYDLNERPNTIIYWRRRFAEQGVDGLYNRPRGSAANIYGADLRDRLLEALHEEPPDSAKRWTGELLAGKLNVPASVVWRYLRKEGIRLSEFKATESVSEPNIITHDIPLQISFKEDNIMSNTKDKMDLEFIARIKGKDGTIIERKVSLADVLPNIDDFDLCTREGFLADFDVYEKAVLAARNQVAEDLTEEYLKEASKKNKKNKP